MPLLSARDVKPLMEIYFITWKNFGNASLLSCLWKKSPLCDGSSVSHLPHPSVDYHVIIPDELLKLADHSLGLGWDMARLCRPDDSAGAAFIFSQAETDGLILAVGTHWNEELALVSVPVLPWYRERNMNRVTMGLDPNALQGVKQQNEVMLLIPF